MTVFFDVDTQLDFLYPAGALYVPGAESIAANVAALNRWAAGQGIPLVSTVDAHTENDPEFASWPPHCVAGAWGQQKPAATLLDKRVVIPNVSGAPDIAGAQQVIIEKQSVNCFTSLPLPGILESLGARRAVVYGVVTEICVRNAALGLLKSGRKAELVTDAVRSLSDADRDAFLKEFAAAGGTLTTLAAIIG